MPTVSQLMPLQFRAVLSKTKKKFQATWKCTDISAFNVLATVGKTLILYNISDECVDSGIPKWKRVLFYGKIQRTNVESFEPDRPSFSPSLLRPPHLILTDNSQQVLIARRGSLMRAASNMVDAKGGATSSDVINDVSLYFILQTMNFLLPLIQITVASSPDICLLLLALKRFFLI